MSATPPRAVLALCLGNICRSPIAHGLLEAHAQRAGLSLEVDSAGTSAHHEGEPPDPRSQRVMSAHNHNISAQRSRPLTSSDVERFDLILAMDQRNMSEAERLKASVGGRAQVALLLEGAREVPDPYYGGARGFEEVYELVDEAAQRWVRRWRAEARLLTLAEAQLKAYNRGDLEAFCACYSDDIRVLDEAGEVTCEGAEAFKERYRGLFERAEVSGARPFGAEVSARALPPQLAPAHKGRVEVSCVDDERWWRLSPEGERSEGRVWVRYTLQATPLDLPERALICAAQFMTTAP